VTLHRPLLYTVLASATNGTLYATIVQSTPVLGGDFEIDSFLRLCFDYCSAVIIHPSNKFKHHLTTKAVVSYNS